MSSKVEANDNVNNADEEISSSETVDNSSEVKDSEESVPKLHLNGEVTADGVENIDKDNAQESSVHKSVTDTPQKEDEHIVEAIQNIVINDTVLPSEDTSLKEAEQPSSSSPKTTEKCPSPLPKAGKESNEDEESLTGNKQVYRLKWIEWHNKKTPIVTQNENGPCPLIAIANILLLRGKIHLRTTIEHISASDLMEYIGDAIMESIPKDLRGPSMLNYEQNMHDAIAILPQLHTGLDVNIKFTGVQHFEYTPECIIFDLLNIPLYHGWLVDPQCQETVQALGNLGYNQLVERIILNKCSSNSDLVTEALIAEQFLERTASQLTYHGLCELNSAMKEEELAVLFRNNHFSTILKKKHELFQLVTDQGFLHEPRVVWETLCNIEGDGQFVDSRFATVPPKAAECFIPETAMTQEQQINQDYLVALSLQEEQKKEQDREQAWQEYRDTLTSSPEISDEELARRMQEEQNNQQPPGRAPSPSSASGRLPPSPGGERGRKGAVCNVI
ncbi:hypothetical protein R5R35_013126 [Gryllus longicercus]|uniref:Ubiquitin carboxyl-terminal hydrolase n=1 Tax=Gryllus longicercus TaxID=2509291 RepID=A0AAN9VZR4_9ORTH